MFDNSERFTKDKRPEFISEIKELYASIEEIIENNAIADCKNVSNNISNHGLSDQKIVEIIINSLSYYLYQDIEEMQYFFVYSEGILEICLFTAIAHYLCNTNRIKGVSEREFVYHYGLDNYEKKYKTRDTMYNSARKNSYGDHGYADFKNEYERFYNHHQGIKGKRREMFYVDELGSNHNIDLENRGDNMQFDYSRSIARPILSEAYVVHWLNCMDDSDKNLHLLPKDFVLTEHLKKAVNAYDTLFKLHNSYFRKLKDKKDLKTSIVNKKSKKLKLDEFQELYKFILDAVNDSRFNEYFGVGLFRAEKQYHFTAHLDLAGQIHDVKDRGGKFKAAFLQTPLKYIPFRHIRQEIMNIEGFIERKCACYAFEKFISEVECMGAVLIDEFIERGVISPDFDKALASMSNELCQRVLYGNGEPTTKDTTQNDFKIVMTTHDEYINFAQGYSIVDEECHKYLKKSIEAELGCEVPDEELLNTFRMMVQLYQNKVKKWVADS